MPVPLSGPSLREKLRQAFDSSSPVPEAPADAGGRPAGVLVPVVDEDDPTVVFTKRADELPRHPGEISFPGGVRHPEDGDLLKTALRETEEELGLSPSEVEVVGWLDPFLTYTTGFWVVPFIGVLRSGARLDPSPAEIAEVLEFPLRTLLEVEREVEWRMEGGVWTGFVYEIGGHTIWGATGRMLHQFIQIVRKELSWPSPS